MRAAVAPSRNALSHAKWFKRTVNIVDSTTLGLAANCIDWAKHRCPKAAAKMHLLESQRARCLLGNSGWFR